MTADAWPEWFADLVAAVHGPRALTLGRFAPPEGHQRRSAVLLLFGQQGSDVDVLLTQRAATLRAHAGQVAFPGGAIDSTDDGPSAAALREAQEETGLEPDGVSTAPPLPPLYLPVSDYAVTPVLAWWRNPSPVAAADPAEVARVVRVPVAELVDPGNRFRVRHPSGFVGPGFAVRELFVWGFTAALLDQVLALAGWDRPWDTDRVRMLPPTAGSTAEPSAGPSVDRSANA